MLKTSKLPPTPDRRHEDSKAYATLFLARAILEGNLPMARAALDAGADVDAHWIDGETTLRHLPALRGLNEIQAHFETLPPFDTTRKLPTYHPSRRPLDTKFWSRELVLLAAAQGHGFATSHTGLGSYPDLGPGASTGGKTAVGVIESRWPGVHSVAVEDCDCEDGRARSAWTVDFLPSGALPHETARSRLTFWVDERGWALVEKFLAQRPRRTPPRKKVRGRPRPMT